MSEWKEYKLGDVIEKFIGGGTPSKAVDEYWNGNIPWASVKDIQDGNYKINSTIDSISKLGLNNSSSNLIPKGTVIIVTRMSLGRCFVADFDVAINQDLKALIPKKNYLNNEFLLWLIVSLSKKIDFLGTGSTVKGITLESLKQHISIKVPPLEEQKRIADVLSCLDAKIENLRQQNNTLEQIAQTLFKHWFIDFEFPNTDGKPYKSSGGEMQSSVLGDIPKGWRVGKLGDVGQVITGKTPSTQNAELWGHDLPFITPTDFKNYGKYILDAERRISRLASSQFKNYVITTNSIVVTCIGSDMGKVAKTATSCITNQQINSIIPFKDFSFHEYIFNYLKNQYKLLRNIALGGSTMPIINKSAFSNIEIILPSLEILNLFENIIDPLNKKIINNATQIQTLTKTRDTLLPKLMSGQIRIEE